MPLDSDQNPRAVLVEGVGEWMDGWVDGKATRKGREGEGRNE